MYVYVTSNGNLRRRKESYCVAVGGSGKAVTWLLFRVWLLEGGITWHPLRNVCFKHLSFQLWWPRLFVSDCSVTVEKIR
jgi:hypothetical protein